MSLCAILFLTLGQTGEIDSKDFSKESQTAALRATVMILNKTTNREGSGVIVKQQGAFVYFLTAGHVARLGDKVEIHVFTEKSYPKPADVYKSTLVLASNKEHDLAVIRLESRDSMPGVLPLCPPKKVLDEKDFPGLSVGCGGGKAPVCEAAKVNGKRKVQRPGEKTTTITWQVGTAPAQGRSGGPLLDKRGYVIGIASGGSDGLGYYVHIEEIHRFLSANGREDVYEEKGK